jgi:MFS family permease
MTSDRALRRQIRSLRAFAALTYPFACVPFLWFWFQEHGVDNAEYGLVIGIYYAVMVIAEVPTGMLADRVGRRPMLIAGPLLLSAGFLVIWARPDLLGFGVGEALLGLGHSVLSGPPAALLYESLERRSLAHEYHRHEAIANTLRLLGTAASFLLGGVLVAREGMPAAILATAALCACAAIAGATVRESGGRAMQIGEPRATLGDAWREFRDPAVRWIGAYYVVLFCLLRFPFHTYQPYLARAGLAEPLFVGGLFCALNVVAAPFSRMTPWFVARFGHRLMFWMMPALIAASLLLMAGDRGALGIALFFLHQIPFGTHWAIVHDWINHRIRTRSRATVLSANSFAGRIAFGALFPLVLLLDDIALAYRVVGLAGLVATALVMTRMPRTG